MVRKIDAHQHFWRIERGDYHWMPDSGPLRKDYLPDDLRPLNDAAGIEGTILVQAAQTVAETDFMLDLASQPDSFILGVVGWVALDSPDAIRQLERYAQHPKLLAVRPMLQDLQDDEWILQPQVLDKVRQLPRLGLRFEVLTYARQLEYAFRALAQIPGSLPKYGWWVLE